MGSYLYLHAIASQKNKSLKKTLPSKLPKSSIQEEIHFLSSRGWSCKEISVELDLPQSKVFKIVISARQKASAKE